jgi:hypothetical protein
MRKLRVKALREVALDTTAQHAEKTGKLTRAFLPTASLITQRMHKLLKRNWTQGDLSLRHRHERDVQSGRFIAHLQFDAGNKQVAASMRLDAGRKHYARQLSGTRRNVNALVKRMRAQDRALSAA